MNDQDWRHGSSPLISAAVQFLEHRDRIRVLRVQLDSFFIIGNGLSPVAIIHVRLRQTVIGIARLRKGFGIELENSDCVFESPGTNETVAESVELVFPEVVDG